MSRPLATDVSVLLEVYFARPGGKPLLLKLGYVDFAYRRLVAAVIDYLLVCSGQEAVNLWGEQVCAY